MSHQWLAETGPLDDAALVCPDPGSSRAFVLTLDVITPLTDDPASFGEIAAANAISDVYAMGGEPQVALSFVGVPEVVPLEMLEAILRGMSDKTAEAGCAIVGGHTIRDSEPKAGLAVIGTVDADRAWTQRRAQAGQALVLTKPIGTGALAQAYKQSPADANFIADAVRWMTTLNRRARDAGVAHGATAATDVTGFGLLGHLRHLAAASGLEAELESTRVPLLDGALAAVSAGLVPAGSRRNLRYVAGDLRGHDALDPNLLLLLADAQTSGGLLLSVAPESADGLVSALGAGAAVVGRLRDGKPGAIALG